MGDNRDQAVVIRTLLLSATQYEDLCISDHVCNKTPDGAPYVPLGGI